MLVKVCELRLSFPEDGECKIGAGCGTTGAFFFTPCSSCGAEDCQDSGKCLWRAGECVIRPTGGQLADLLTCAQASPKYISFVNELHQMSDDNVEIIEELEGALTSWLSKWIPCTAAEKHHMISATEAKVEAAKSQAKTYILEKIKEKEEMEKIIEEAMKQIEEAIGEIIEAANTAISQANVALAEATSRMDTARAASDTVDELQARLAGRATTVQPVSDCRDFGSKYFSLLAQMTNMSDGNVGLIKQLVDVLKAANSNPWVFPCTNAEKADLLSATADKVEVAKSRAKEYHYEQEIEEQKLVRIIREAMEKIEQANALLIATVTTTFPYTSPPYTRPPHTKPPNTKPPYTKPPYTKPPYTKPPYTKPPYTRPTYTKPPYTKPPYTSPPYTKPPYTGSSYTRPSYPKTPTTVSIPKVNVTSGDTTHVDL